MSNHSQSNEPASPVISADDASNLGEIKINHSVVAGIVRFASLKVEGTASVEGSFVEGLTELFSRKESERGVRVNEDAAGNYEIEVRVILKFGVELTKTAVKIQQSVRDYVTRMTMKPVSRVDVIIDGVQLGDAQAEREFHVADEHPID
jgi:uncharacterized alkaline shock family protein YloU